MPSTAKQAKPPVTSEARNLQENLVLPLSPTNIISTLL